MVQTDCMISMLESSRLINGEISSLFLEGEPGVGKTHFATLYCEYLESCNLELDLRFIQCNASTSKPEMLFQLNTPVFIERLSGNDNQDQLIIFSELVEGMRHSHDRIQVIVIDEIDKANPEIDPYLLPILEEGFSADPMLTAINNGEPIKAKKENFVVLSTTNGSRELAEPLRRRGTFVIMLFPPKKVMKKIIAKMTTHLQDDLSANQISYAIDFMYKYRGLAPQHTMVQNQLVRILSDVVYCQQYKDFSTFKEMFKLRLSPEINDLELCWEKIHDLNHITRSFYG